MRSTAADLDDFFFLLCMGFEKYEFTKAASELFSTFARSLFSSFAAVLNILHAYVTRLGVCVCFGCGGRVRVRICQCHVHVSHVGLSVVHAA